MLKCENENTSEKERKVGQERQVGGGGGGAWEKQ